VISCSWGNTSAVQAGKLISGTNFLLIKNLLGIFDVLAGDVG